jgi:hypothetical protein
LSTSAVFRSHSGNSAERENVRGFTGSQRHRLRGHGHFR